MKLVITVLFFTLSFFGPALRAQTPAAAPEPDTLIFNDGEKLIGHLVRSTGNSVVFKSDMAGEITVDWSKIKELHSNSPYAVIGKDVKLRKGVNPSTIPQGKVEVSDKNLTVTPTPLPPPPANVQAAAPPPQTPQTLPTDKAGYVIDEATFQKAVLSRPNFFHNWAGSVTAGASLVQATQSSRSFTGAVHLERDVPNVSWLELRNKTLLDFAASYGEVTQTGTPTIKTNIIHGGLERDEYFSDRLYAFGLAQWDHNFSQGLDLQQTYGGGLGWSVIKRDNETLDLKAGITYIRRQFASVEAIPPAVTLPAPPSDNLIGSIFGEAYMRKLPHGILFNQSLVVTPSWNDLSAYSAIGNANLALPVYKRFNLTLGVVDSYLNNPAPGFQKNSFQFIAGLTYVLP